MQIFLSSHQITTVTKNTTQVLKFCYRRILIEYFYTTIKSSLTEKPLCGVSRGIDSDRLAEGGVTGSFLKVCSWKDVSSVAWAVGRGRVGGVGLLSLFKMKSRYLLRRYRSAIPVATNAAMMMAESAISNASFTKNSKKYITSL